ncbi:hypothetical protein P3T35_008106, partial [Kitasatospora sp. GP30]|uniref:group II intron maturase-specific domain-containing protein n=1 Tax=Kitasatospora sp. GP30 TaxID=3035084 RepID=UPI0024735923
WHVYTFIAARPVRQLKAKIRALTHRTSQQDLRSVLIRINQITRGWSAYFRHAVAKSQFSTLASLIWWRLIRMLRTRHGQGHRDPLPMARRSHPQPLGSTDPLTTVSVESPLRREAHDGCAP